MKNKRFKPRAQGIASCFSFAVTIATFNAEHFGLQSDFLLQNKLFNIHQMLLPQQTPAPDIVLLNEVESTTTMEKLADQFFPDLRTHVRLGKEAFMSPGLITRFPIAAGGSGNRPEKIPLPKLPHSREILKVILDLPREKIVILGFHFPSQFHEVSQRKIAFATLKRALTRLKGKTWIALGDSNVTTQEDDAFHFLHDPTWLLSNAIGCFDCDGTYFYRGLWSFFDVMLFSPRLACRGESAYYVDPTSIHTGSHAKTPFRFEKKSGQGSSDHFPLFATLRLRSENPAKNCTEFRR